LDYGWQSYTRENIEGYYRRALSEVERLALVLEQMETALGQAAQKIQDADQASSAEFLPNDRGSPSVGIEVDSIIDGVIAGGVIGGGVTIGGGIDLPSSLLSSIAKRTEDFFDNAGDISDYVKGIGDGADVISDVWGVKHLSGLSGNAFKDAWQLGKGDLTGSLKDFKQPIGKGGQVDALVVVGVACEVASEIGENWHEYEGDPGKIAGGIIFDSALGIGVSLGASAIGTGVGALIGTAIAGPAGTVIGGKIGGIAAGWLANKFDLDEKIEDIKIGGQELDERVAGAIDTVIDTAVETTYETVEKGLGLVADKVASLF
jgi:hypothetical protein